MSSASKVTLSLAVAVSVGTVLWVHHRQQQDREALHEGVLRDMERRQRRAENVRVLQEQAQLTRHLGEANQAAAVE